MPENETAAEATDEATTEQPETGEPDYKALYEAAHADAEKWKSLSRKNQDRAKSNAEAAKELDDANQQVADLTQRLEALEGERDALVASAKRQEDVSAAAERAKVPAEVVAMLNGSDADELAEQAKRLLKLLPAYPTRTDDGGTKVTVKKTDADRFAEALGL